jgi:hypothetical protein
MTEAPIFIYVPKIEGYSDTINLVAIKQIVKAEEDNEGCRVILFDGSVINCSDSKRTMDARINIATGNRTL